MYIIMYIFMNIKTTFQNVHVLVPLSPPIALTLLRPVSFSTQANRDRKLVVDFKLELRRAQHAAILECFRAYNRKGGAVLPLQTGEVMYFPRACILAIYGDFPAARKCSLTGSSCPACFTPETRMNRLVQEPRFEQKRTPATMRARKRVLNVMRNVPARGAAERAIKKGKTIGVNLCYDTAWGTNDEDIENWVFGPDPNRDNIWQNLPQVTLHGMDEGLTQYCNRGILEAVIKEARELRGYDATKVYYNVHVNVHSNVHLK